MIAFWTALVIGVAVAVVYVTLAVQSFARVRRDVLEAAAKGEHDDLAVDTLDDDGVFTWKALGAVVGSTIVIVLLGVDGVFWYLPPILAVGSSVAVIAAFLIDRRRTI
jgi:hypothetical protein